MRRQVKPFVTEYRGTPRRTKDLPAGGDPHQEGQASRSRSYAEAQKVFQPESPEDSYEAAMRAADALFSSERAEPAQEPVKPPSASSAFRTAPTEADDAFVQDAGAQLHEDRQADAPPRRILQAIEPPQEDRFAALEAERAPKRRGRKPGSKNKPKLQVGDDWAAAMQPVAASTSTKPAARSRVAASPVPAAPRFSLADFIVEDDIEEPAIEGVEVEVPAVDDALPPPRGRTDKFGWKREGLRPGERWKRRLPKAAR